jgi:predicted nucleic acid-binding protein
MDVLFLDANVLFSASYRPSSGLRRLWDLEEVRLVTSGYAVEEATRNLEAGEARERLAVLLGHIEVVPEPPQGTEVPPDGVDLPEKDLPILRAAVASGATHLITGDLSHFGPYFGRRLAGVRILTPGDYLRTRS